MATRLTRSNPQREQAAQERIILALTRKYGRLLAAEIKRASVAMLDGFRLRGSVPELPETHRPRIEAIYRDLSEEATRAMGGRILAQGKSAGRNIETKDFAEVFERVAMEYIQLEAVRQRITNVSETTRAQIVQRVAAGQVAGLGVVEIAKSISFDIPGISRMRGALIGRTETHGAANHGADQAARATGLPLMKEWVASGGSRTRDDHAEANGQQVPMDSPFKVGGELLMFPGDPIGSPWNTINCRCSVSHIVV